jgi:hypothetical protein
MPIPPMPKRMPPKGRLPLQRPPVSVPREESDELAVTATRNRLCCVTGLRFGVVRVHGSWLKLGVISVRLQQNIRIICAPYASQSP